jgi:hypothetical protein
MHVDSFRYDSRSGWSVPAFPPGDSESTLVLVFGAPRYAGGHAAIEELTQAYPRAIVAGCSTAGEIHGKEIFDDSLSVAVIRFEKTALRVAHAAVTHTSGSLAAGRSVAASLASEGLGAILVFSDGISINGSDLVRGIHEVSGKDVVVTGGLAGDGSNFTRTWVIVSGRPVEGAVVGVGLYGSGLEVGHGSRGGWDIFGPERRVTRANGNVLYELDGKPALALYKTYLGDRANGLPATALLFPLALLEGTNGRKTLVRTVLAVDEAAQSMTFAGDIPEGSLVQLMRANFDRLIEGAAEAGRAANGQPSGESVSIAISCVGRRLVLGERAEEEVEAAAESLPAGTHLLGFYSYGEISPFAAGERSDLHNQTMTVTTLWETD